MINKLISKKIWSEIKKSKNILLTLHPSPDGDSIGSNLALYFAITKLGKKVTLIGGDSDFPKNFSSIPGTDKILPKNFFQLDLNDYDLFIMADIAGTNQISKRGEIVFPKNLKTIIIDHHASNPKFADINLVNPNSPATCQIVFDIFKDLKIKITKEIAACLFIGIYTDTGGFKYSNTTYKTFLAVAELSQIYPSFDKLVFNLENNDRPDRLKFMSLMLGSIDTYLSSKIAIASIDFDTIQKNKINTSVVNGSEIANLVKSVIGWEIGVSLIEFQPKSIKVSFRTRDSEKYDLTKISVAIGGGGHKAAAGANMNMSIDEAKKVLVKNIKALYPDLKE